jgi:hypothetical protein
MMRMRGTSPTLPLPWGGAEDVNLCLLLPLLSLPLPWEEP